MQSWLRKAPCVCLLIVPVGLFAQSAGSISGTVTRADGSFVTDAPIRARNSDTGTDARARSGEDGKYSLVDLPAGEYLVTVNMPCCLFEPYINTDVALGAAEALALDIALTEIEFDIEGDDPATVNADLRARQVIPDLPVPRTADGHPDLTGVWLTSEDPFPEDPQALPWAAELAGERIASNFYDHPHMFCLPGTPPAPGAATFTSKFVQTPELIVILFEGTPGVRQIFMDGRGHPENPNPTWMGHSIGRWEGDTLVVDTVGFNDRGWTEAFPRTEMLRVEERYRRTEYGKLSLRITFDDPGVFEVPWTLNQIWDLAPQEEILEYVCENNKWAH